MRSPSRSTVYFSFAAFLVFAAFSAGLAKESSGGKGSFYQSFEQLYRVLARLNEAYVEEIPPDQMVEAAVKGMTSILDPHTAYFDAKATEDLKVHTEGEFGGLGITIGVREKILTVISPLVGTPAYRMGIQAGDRILEIDGRSTRGMIVDTAVNHLRGKPGTNVTIKVWREGFTEPLPFKFTREVIKIESVPYYGMLPGQVGFIKLVQFSRTTGDDMDKAVAELKKQGMKSLILDLRYNPGGLLTEAVAVSELFLPKGKVVVSTKGRITGQNSELLSERAPLVDPNLPLVVLVNGGSASASEIVAGAIQDWDRGVIMGTQSYGKGSVQTINQMDATHILKLTTAFYYTPSGRCINKKENSIRFKNVDSAKVDTAKKDPEFDEELGVEIGEKADTSFDTTGHKSFKTLLLGRKVWDAGGILPDIRVAGRAINPYQQELERKTVFFRWAIKARPLFEKKGKIDTSIKVTDALIEDFRKFLTTDSVKFRFESPAVRMLKELRKTLDRDQKTADSLPADLRKGLALRVDDLDSALSRIGDHEFDRNREYIREGLARELLMAAGGTKAGTSYQLKFDPQVKAALELLQNPARYKSVLSVPAKK
jgi:carboxyl-terminal processing protease